MVFVASLSWLSDVDCGRTCGFKYAGRCFGCVLVLSWWVLVLFEFESLVPSFLVPILGCRGRVQPDSCCIRDVLVLDWVAWWRSASPVVVAVIEFHVRFLVRFTFFCCCVDDLIVAHSVC